MGVAMVGVPGRINHKDRQRTMCDVRGGGDQMVARRAEDQDGDEDGGEDTGEDGGEGGETKYVLRREHQTR